MATRGKGRSGGSDEGSDCRIYSIHKIENEPFPPGAVELWAEEARTFIANPQIKSSPKII
jgi:hypothetical protein